jgi:plastocyanin
MNSIHTFLRAMALAALSLMAGMGQDRQFQPAQTSSEASPMAVSAPCIADSLTLCLNGARFQVRVNWRVPSQGTSGVGTGVALTGDTGYFWFFSPNNIELVLKVVDGRAFNGMFWVFYGALSDVEYTITVTDTAIGTVKTYSNPSGNLASVADTAAFSGGNGLRADQEEESNVQSPRSKVGDATEGQGPDFGPRTLDLGPLSSSEAPCTPSANELCLNNNRFKVEVSWRVPAQGTSGKATAVPLTGDTGQFWFFSANNIELVIKALDGRPVNGQYWIFYGALSNVEYTITVTDTLTGYVKTFANPSGNLASVADTSGFSAAATPTPPPTSTPNPTPTPTPPSGGAIRIVNVGPNGLSAFRDTVSNSSTTTIKAGDTVQWVFQSASNYHSATSGTCTDGGDPYGGGYSTCTPDNVFDSGVQTSPATYSMKFTGVGSFPYFCGVHGSMMTGMVVVTP